MSIKKFIKEKKQAFDKYKASQAAKDRMKARLAREQELVDRKIIAQEAREARAELKAYKQEQKDRTAIDAVKAYKKPAGSSFFDKMGAGFETFQKKTEPLFELGHGMEKAADDTLFPSKDLFGNKSSGGGFGFDLFGESSPRKSRKKPKKRKKRSRRKKR